MDSIYFEELKRICIDSGFAHRRKTFFRLVGDGVLQVIKGKYQRNLEGDIIFVGLVSMYGNLQPEWFEASSRIPRYSIINCFYQNHMPLIHAFPLETQLDMLRSQVMPWLDSIDTQKKLKCAISKLNPGWLDELKIGPYLACGEINHAKKVVREILAQRDSWGNSRIWYCEESNGMLFLKKEQEGDNLQGLWEMLARENPDEINTYLKKNYTRNMEHAKFCTSNTGRKTGDGSLS